MPTALLPVLYDFFFLNLLRKGQCLHLDVIIAGDLAFTHAGLCCGCLSGLIMF